MKYTTINLTKNQVTLIDLEDYEKIIIRKWQAVNSGKNTPYYARATLNNKSISMHRFILNLSNSNLIVDHINGNTLDNRKCNLRITDRKGNAQNARKRKDGKTSKYKGVRFRNSIKKYEANISFNSKIYYLGCFKTEIEAAIAYNKAAKKFHKQFAVLNEV